MRGNMTLTEHVQALAPACILFQMLWGIYHRWGGQIDKNVFISYLVTEYNGCSGPQSSPKSFPGGRSGKAGGEGIGISM